MKDAIRLALMASAGLWAVAAPVYAQDSQDNQDSDSANADGEIIVTATRRAERLQDVPLAVNAISGEDLAEAGFRNLTDIQYQFSGVQFGVTGQDGGFRLRGVGTAGGFSSASEQNVGTVVDNVVIPFGNPIGSLGDLERVEVLKGPQGTQFGKNASSGVVNITTMRPALGEVSGNAYASYAELNEHDIHGSINLPLGSKAALNVYGFHRQHDGFVRNVVRNETWGGQENYGARAKLLWEPTDDLSIYVIGDWSRINREGPIQLWTLQRIPSLANPQTAGRFNPVLALGIVPGFNNTVSAEEGPGFSAEVNYGGSLEINYSLGDYTLTSVSAYRKLDERPQAFALDTTPLPIFTAQGSGIDRSFISEEIRLTSPQGATFEYVAGVYLSRLKSGYDGFTSAQLRPGQPFNPFIVSITNGRNTATTKSDSIAGFIDGSVRLAESFRILGGLRVQKDNVDAAAFTVIDPNFPPAPPGPPRPNVVNNYTPRPLATGSTSATDWSGRIGFDFKPSENILLFGTLARGYLGPTVTFSGLTGTRVEVAPQTVRDITFGAKMQFLDKALTVNVNAFFDKYKNLQTQVLRNNEFITENAGGFNADGFELELIMRPSERFSFNAGYTYSKTRFTDYVTDCPQNFQAAGAAAIAANCTEPTTVGGVARYQARGEPLPGAPLHSLTVGADFNQPVGDRLLFEASANYYLRSRVQYNVGNPDSAQDGYGIAGLNFALGDVDGAWRVSLFARNLFDTRFHAAIGPLSFSAPGGIWNWNTRDGRRTLGASIETRF